MSDKSNRTTEYIRSMLKYCQDVLDIQATSGGTYEAFISDKGYQYSVSFCVEQIGELAKKLRDEGFAKKYPNIRWNAIAGMRNHIAHGYGTIDLKVVYQVCAKDIPALLIDCRHMLLNETRDVNEKMALAEALKDDNHDGESRIKREEREE